MKVLNTDRAKEKIAKFMLELYDEEFFPYATKYNLWFFNRELKIWLSPRKMREEIAKGNCNLADLGKWDYVGPNNLSKYAKDRIEHWFKVKNEAEQEEKLSVEQP